MTQNLLISTSSDCGHSHDLKLDENFYFKALQLIYKFEGGWQFPSLPRIEKALLGVLCATWTVHAQTRY